MSRKSKSKKNGIPPINAKHTVSVIEEFIRTRVFEAKVDGVIIGVSGGIDSAVVLTLAVRALGSEKVNGYFLQNKNSSPDNIKDVLEYCKTLKVNITKMKMVKI